MRGRRSIWNFLAAYGRGWEVSVLEQLKPFVINPLSGEGGFFRDGAEVSLAFGCGARAAVLDGSWFEFAKLAIGIGNGPFDDFGFSGLGPLSSIHG